MADVAATVPERLTDEAIERIDLDDLAPAMPAPGEGVERHEGFVRTPDDQRLFWQSWEPARGADASLEPLRGAIALMHGFGEHSARYDHVATAFARAGYATMAIDARGHGRSTGRRAHVGRYDEYVDDYALLTEQVGERWPDQPLFHVGHSNGGLIVLRYALQQPEGCYIVTSPMCGLAVQVPPPKAIAGKVMSRVWPTFSLPTELDPAYLSHIDRVVDKYRNDPLVLDVATARWFTEALAAQDDLADRAGSLDQPFLFLLSGHDELVDAACAERIFHKMGSGDREMEIFPDLYHEILNEEAWGDIVRRMLRWMERHRVDASSRSPEAAQ